MSTNEMRVGMISADLARTASFSSRGSGTAISPTFGSVMPKWSFAACAAAVCVSALKSVDLPTFGRPTMPHLNPMIYPYRLLVAPSFGGGLILVVDEALCTHCEMHLVLERRILAFDQQADIVGDGVA